MGAAAPSLSTLPDRSSSAAAQERKTRKITGEEIPDVESGFERENTPGLDIPRSFTTSPTNQGNNLTALKDEFIDELNECLAEAHISTIVEASTDEESCPSGESEAKGGNPKATLQESVRAHRCHSTPSHLQMSDKPLTEQTTTPFQTPSRKACVYVKTPAVKFNGARYFNTSVLEPEIHNDMALTEEETEQQSDETLKQTNKPKRKMPDREQMKSDITLLQEILEDDARRRSL
ncbi:Pol polyprotein/retrotransposon [Ceratobasidium sp. AG-Ba]|nr:Pol polyprotein/retrotransposon [Ceratobasidium sp. AG-Ba]